MWYMIKSLHGYFMLKITRFFPVSDFLLAQPAICNIWCSFRQQYTMRKFELEQSLKSAVMGLVESQAA